MFIIFTYEHFYKIPDEKHAHNSLAYIHTHTHAKPYKKGPTKHMKLIAMAINWKPIIIMEGKKEKAAKKIIKKGKRDA